MFAKTVAVVGRGIAGLATSHRLIKRGYSVISIAPRIENDSGSEAALGMASIRGQFSWKRSPVLYEDESCSWHGILAR